MTNTAPQNVIELLNSLIQTYPKGLPEGIHVNINLDFSQASANVDGEEPPDVPGTPPAGPVYKGPFLGLYRVVATNEARRIKIRSDSDPLAPEVTIRVEPRHLTFMRALNPTKPTYLETNGYIFQSQDATPKTMFRQYGFDGQLLVVAETKKISKTVMGRVVGIGSDPLISDPKPLDATQTNNIHTPWLVHQIPGLLVYVPIFSGADGGWVNMDELEKIR